MLIRLSGTLTARLAPTSAVVSRTTEPVPAVLGLPAVSVCVALTLMMPSPSALSSALLSVTEPVVAMLAATVLVRLFAPLVNVSEAEAPASLLTLTLTPVALSLALIKPSPEMAFTTGALGATVSTVAIRATVVVVLPAKSYALAVKLCVAFDRAEVV